MESRAVSRRQRLGGACAVGGVRRQQHMPPASLGGTGGLLSLITSRLAVNRDNVTSAIGYLLPAIVGRLTPGGSVPATVPPEVASLAAAGQSLLAAPSTSAAAEAPAAGSAATAAEAAATGETTT